MAPFCTRCGTALSSHELGQPHVYRPVVDESAFVRFPLLDEGDAAGRLAASLGRDTVEGLSLVAWTTTPWTLLSNTGAAVGPDLSYAVVDDMIVASDLVAAVFGEDAQSKATVAGIDLVWLPYRRPSTTSTPRRAAVRAGEWSRKFGRGRRGNRDRPPGSCLWRDRPACGAGAGVAYALPGGARRSL